MADIQDLVARGAPSHPCRLLLTPGPSDLAVARAGQPVSVRARRFHPLGAGLLVARQPAEGEAVAARSGRRSAQLT
jgi:hypothetical protein